MTLPFNTLIPIERPSHLPVYIQVSNGLVNLIRDGKITPGTFLPGTREMAELLSIHRKTTINAYDELAAQGWIEALPRKGFRVVPDLPIVKPRTFKPKNNFPAAPAILPELLALPALVRPGAVSAYSEDDLVVDDGFPDTQLTPYSSFLQLYRQQLQLGQPQKAWLNKDEGGLMHLRSSSAGFLNQTRGLNITEERLMITRGAQMAIYITAALLIRPGDNVIVSEPNYFMADHIFQSMGAVIHRVPVDQEGMDTDRLAALLQTGSFRLLYVIPHHHHPTTVTMSSARRMHLLNLIKQHQLWVIEDDYDYDFHYRNNPILPLASAEHEGRIIYIGSYTKLLGPSFRIGYLVAARQIVEQAIKYRRLMDIRGDFMMESALATLIDNGALGRHIKRSKKIYATRMELAAGLIAGTLPHAIHFNKPQGGMALWLKFREDYPLARILAKAPSRKLHLTGSAYFEGHNSDYNSLRFGFASLPADQLKNAITTLAAVIAGS
ncbi:aminotransferase-like domain-containing protein [Taibaiella koreensis]|uniref:aminotransferase-like domain-containing protein n=1 Tax=Taibaiella koreensis TaxID=1268548 RepID=UPI000E59FFB5|nr:PLP-dependent aminotransferase family protein [Taibaiella koreensis]